MSSSAGTTINTASDLREARIPVMLELEAFALSLIFSPAQLKVERTRDPISKIE